jgi:hypothetical protein
MEKNMRFKIFLLCVTSMAAAIFSGCEPETGGGDYLETLVGTEWEWGSQYGRRTLEFDSPDHLFFYNDHGNGAEPARLDDYYTYDSSTGTGTIRGEYPAGDFYLAGGNGVMRFTNFKNYGHGADFLRRK